MLVLAILVGSAILCAFIASSKNKNVFLWAVLGFLFPLISLLILAFSSDGSADVKAELNSPAAGLIDNKTYDREKWRALMQYDDDIKHAADTLSPLGEKYVEKLAAAYLALNDKSYLPSIVEKIEASSREDKISEGILAEAGEFHKHVRDYFVTPHGNLIVLRDGRTLAQVNGEVLAYNDPTHFRQMTGARDEVWDEVTDGRKKAEFVPIFRKFV